VTRVDDLRRWQTAIDGPVDGVRRVPVAGNPGRRRCHYIVTKPAAPTIVATTGGHHLDLQRFAVTGVWVTDRRERLDRGTGRNWSA
jgi:hypothetical protein